MSWTSIDRYVKGKVEVYRASTLLYTFLPADYLKSIEMDKPNIKAFFGYAISQQGTITMIDKDYELDIQQGDTFICYLAENDSEYIRSPEFIVDEVKRNDMDLVVKGYDKVNLASQYLFKDLTLNLPSNIEDCYNQICAVLGIEGIIEGTVASFTVSEQPNYNENDTLRMMLEDIAEALGCICFVDGGQMVLKALTADNAYTIDKANYFNLTTGTEISLSSVISRGALEDNVQAGEGTAQILVENGFIVNRTDLADILDNLLENVNGLTITPYDLNWRGNPNLKMGDYIALEDKKGNVIYTYYLGENLKYNGGLSASSVFELTYEDTLYTNSTTIGDRINETIAKVDKINKTIELRVSEAIENDTTVAELKLSVGQIESSVVELEGEVETAKSEMTQTATELTSRVETAEGNASTALQTANSFETRISDAEDNASTAIQTANSFSTRITDAEGNINSIEQSLEGVAYTSSLANGTTTINGGCITTGTIDASKAKISNLSVYNANIVSLDADKITVKGKTLGDGSYLSNIYSNYGSIGSLGTMTLTLNSNSPDEGQPVYLTCAGVQVNGSSLVSWSDIFQGNGEAVFG